MTWDNFLNFFRGTKTIPTKDFVQPVMLMNELGETYVAGGGTGGGSTDITTLAKEGKQDAGNTILNSILAELRDDVFVQATIWEDRSNTTSVFYREERIRSQDDGSIATVYTRLSDNTVVGSLPAGCIPASGATDRLIQYYRYIAVNAGTGYAVGNFIANTLIFDSGGTGAIIGSTWYNLSTGTAIATTPNSADLIDPQDWLRTAFGAQIDSAASSDTGTFSLMAFIKRALTNWTTLLARIPALISGRMPVDVSGAVTVGGVSAVGVAPSLPPVSISGVDGGGLKRHILTDSTGKVETLNSNLGATADAVATTDTGTFSLIALVKRALTNWSTLLGRIQVAGQLLANSIGIALPRKQSITGLAVTVASTAYTNLLDNAAGSAATDVRDFQNGVLIVASTATTGSYTVQGAFDLGFTVGVKTIQLSEIDVQNINPLNGAITPTAATRAFFANLAGINYLRINLTTGVTTGNVVTYAVLNQANYTPNQVNVQQATGGNLNVVISSGTITTVTTVTTLSQFAASAAAGDATANPTTTIIRAINQLFNGTTWDRSYNNTEVTLLASAARTTTQASADIINFNWKKLVVMLDMTVIGTGSVTLSIDGKDTVSGKYYNILTGAAITTNSTNRYRVGELLAAVANSVAQDYLPRIIRITVTANNANSATYSVGYNFGL